MKKLSFLIAVAAMVLFAGCGAKRSQAYYDAPSTVLSTTTQPPARPGAFKGVE